MTPAEANKSADKTTFFLLFMFSAFLTLGTARAALSRAV